MLFEAAAIRTVVKARPCWVKLTRTGNVFTAQHSADGITWVDITATNPVEIPMFIGGNSVMCFNRIDSTKVPAGFDTKRVLYYNPSSYEEHAQ